MARVTPCLEYGGFEQLDMVIEAVIEDLPLKQRIFADLERRGGNIFTFQHPLVKGCSAGVHTCVPAGTLTGVLRNPPLQGVQPELHPVDQHQHNRHLKGAQTIHRHTPKHAHTAVQPNVCIHFCACRRAAAPPCHPQVGANVRTPERVIGAHFFSPAHVMPLFEIVKTDRTSKQCIVDTLGLSKQIKKTPVVVGNCTGFAVNRVFFPYTMSAFLLVDAGLDIYRLDAVIKDVFGMPMGPFRLSDLVGGDVGMHVGANFIESFPDRVYPTNLLPNMCAAKRMGEKTGAGFYKYDAKRKASPDPEGVAPFLKISRDTTAGRVRAGSPYSSLMTHPLH